MREICVCDSLPRLSWERAGVGVEAVLNLSENRLFPAQQKPERGSAAENSHPALPRSTPTSFLPQDTGEDVRIEVGAERDQTFGRAGRAPRDGLGQRRRARHGLAGLRYDYLFAELDPPKELGKAGLRVADVNH